MLAEDLVRVRHMIDAGDLMATFIAGRVRADLDNDPKLLYAPEGRSRMPEVPWPAIIGMRNRLIHGYFDVDAEIVWATATSEIPILLPKLRSAADL